MRVDGKCLCGSLEFEAEIDPASVHIGHCTDCEVLAGSGLPDDGFCYRRVLLSERRTQNIRESRRKRQQSRAGFCPTCGTSIYSRPEDGKAGYFGCESDPCDSVMNSCREPNAGD